MRILRSFLFLSFTSMASLSLATTIRIPTDFRRIQDAVDAASSGDILLVGPGTYVENIDFKGKDIKLRSELGWEHTIIDGNRSGPVVSFRDYESQDAEITGFTITNGYDPNYLGGGIHCFYYASPTIRQNRIIYNEARAGGGIYVSCGDCKIIENIISHNIASIYVGGGVHVSPMSYSVVLNNIITNNRTTGYGGEFRLMDHMGHMDLSMF